VARLGAETDHDSLHMVYFVLTFIYLSHQVPHWLSSGSQNPTILCTVPYPWNTWKYKITKQLVCKMTKYCSSKKKEGGFQLENVNCFRSQNFCGHNITCEPSSEALAERERLLVKDPLYDSHYSSSLCRQQRKMSGIMTMLHLSKDTQHHYSQRKSWPWSTQ